MASYAVQGVTGNLCFIAGTLVLCMDEDGNQCHKPIEDVKVGDMVWAYDEETGENAWKPVVRLLRNQTKEWYHVFVDGEEIVCTAEHPFYVVDKGFVPARVLKADDKLLLANGKQVAIDKIEIENLAEFENTYNFEVADFHTYYVSESNVLVHNKCGEQEHHYLTNKNKEFTPQIKKITDKYKLDLDGGWNKELLPHCGRHAKAYHKYMLEGIKKIDSVAKGKAGIFLKEFEVLKSTVRANPDIMYKAFWLAGGFG